MGSRFKVVGLALRDLVLLVSLIRTFSSEKVSSSSTVGTYCRFVGYWLRYDTKRNKS